MKAWLLCALAVTFASHAAANAQTFPIIDVQHGYLIGAVQSGKWREPTDVVNSVKPGGKLPVYGVMGKIGSIEALKVDTANEACPDRAIVKLKPRKLKSGGVAFSAKWNPLPRKIQAVDANQKQHVDVVRDFLLRRGLIDPVVGISQIARVDLDGDGQDEFVISATHYKNGTEIPDESTANTYSCVIVERTLKGKATAELVDGEFYPKAKADAAPNKFEIAALLDLNGDGKIDIVLRSAYYEGDEISVYEFGSAAAKKILSVGCGL